MTTTLTVLRFRLKDKHDAELRRQARAVNFVWNHCQEAQLNALRWGKKWPSGYDLSGICAGSSKMLGLLSNTIDLVCTQYERSRRHHRKRTLRWRGKKSLGWIPLKDGVVRFDGTGFVYRGARLDAWITHDMPVGMRFRQGRISQDARGRWYINLTTERAIERSAGTAAIGVDLGLKTLATMSDGQKVEAPRWFRKQQGADRNGAARQQEEAGSVAAREGREPARRSSAQGFPRAGARARGHLRRQR